MIFPIGRYAGAAADGTHEVRRGGATERLDPESFAAWGLAHGPIDPVLAAATRWTRQELVRYAGLAGVPDVDGRVAGLVGRGLLVEADPDAASGFARSHRAVPLALGFGNSPDEPARFSIGFPDRALAQVDELRYEVWCWSAAYQTLWQVCEARAGDPAETLSHFLTGVHQLASANALYLEVAE